MTAEEPQSSDCARVAQSYDCGSAVRRSSISQVKSLKELPLCPKRSLPDLHVFGLCYTIATYEHDHLTNFSAGLHS